MPDREAGVWSCGIRADMLITVQANPQLAQQQHQMMRMRQQQQMLAQQQNGMMDGYVNERKGEQWKQYRNIQSHQFIHDM